MAKKQDTTMLLADCINHPAAEMHELFADMLFGCIFAEEPEIVAEHTSTMWSEG